MRVREPTLKRWPRACARLGIALDVIGSGSGNGVPHPECVLGGYDLVFAKARCALEAMATGTAVVLCDTSGLGPMVTTANVERLRPWNFGARCLKHPLDSERIVEEMRRYDSCDARRVAGYIRGHAALDGAVREYLAIYREALAEPAPPGGDEVAGYLRATAERMGSLESAVESAHSHALDGRAGRKLRPAHRNFDRAGCGVRTGRGRVRGGGRDYQPRGNCPGQLSAVSSSYLLPLARQTALAERPRLRRVRTAAHPGFPKPWILEHGLSIPPGWRPPKIPANTCCG